MFTDLFSILLIVVLIATLLTLILGVVSMFTSKPSDSGVDEKSNRLMRWRVLLQALALLLLAILLFFKR